MLGQHLTNTNSISKPCFKLHCSLQFQLKGEVCTPLGPMEQSLMRDQRPDTEEQKRLGSQRHKPACNAWEVCLHGFCHSSRCMLALGMSHLTLRLIYMSEAISECQLRVGKTWSYVPAKILSAVDTVNTRIKLIHDGTLRKSGES